MESLISFQHVSIVRQGRFLLDDVTWETKRSEHWAILGANGAGKTTLLQTILGYLWPSKGQIHVLTHQLGKYDVRELRKSIGFVSTNMDSRLEADQSALAITVSGRYAAYGLYEDIRKEDREEAMHFLSMMEAGQLATEPYQLLSQGEKQKVLIARSLMAHPSILILDEPCNGLDFPSRERLIQTIQNLCSTIDAPQVLYVTHYPDEIMPAISHTLLLRDGSIVGTGLKEEVLTEELLSMTFAIAVQVSFQNNYPVVRLKH